MDLILRLHPNQEKDLIDQQKLNLFEINSRFEFSVAFPNYPLVCPLTNDFFIGKLPKDLKNSFNKITVEGIEIEESRIICPVHIEIKNFQDEITEKITIGTLLKKEIFYPKKDFSISCRTFQIAQIKKTGFSYEIWNPVWCKTK